VDGAGFEEFLLDASKEYEVEGIVVSPKIYKNNKQIKHCSLNTSLFHKFEI
jgi:hypothetical protein